jgi:hypothetical protein
VQLAVRHDGVAQRPTMEQTTGCRCNCHYQRSEGPLMTIAVNDHCDSFQKYSHTCQMCICFSIFR